MTKLRLQLYKSAVQLFIFFFLFISKHSAQVSLNADGPGDTYELISSILAPGYNPIEVPDCDHSNFGRNIDEIFDNGLNKYVFRFILHTSPDNDRCINFDRQRNEIKSYDKSPDNLLGIEGEIVTYSWKFKLPEGFQSSPNFTHLHQLKSVGGNLASMPMYTLTTRKGNPDQLELRYAETDSQITLKKVNLSPFIGIWVQVIERVEYGIDGTYSIQIRRNDNQELLFDFSSNSIINWRSGADFVRPKWGIYRSLINVQDLRKEEVLFSDFSISEGIETSVNQSREEEFSLSPNPAKDNIMISDLPTDAENIKIIDSKGKSIHEININGQEKCIIDISSIQEGIYLIIIETSNTILLEKFIKH